MANTIGPKFNTPAIPPTTAKVVEGVTQVVAKVAKSMQGVDVGSTFDTVSSTADWTQTAIDGLGHTKLSQASNKLAQSARAMKVAEKLQAAAPILEKVSLVAVTASAVSHSDSATTEGKVLAGAATAGLTKLAINGLSTPVAIADMALNTMGEKLVGEKLNQAAGGYISGHAISTPATLATAYFEAFRGDMRAMDAFSQKARAGEYGAIYKAAIESGDYWAQHGILGGLKEAKENFVNAGGVSSLVGFAKDRWQAARNFFKS